MKRGKNGAALFHFMSVIVLVVMAITLLLLRSIAIKRPT